MLQNIFIFFALALVTSAASAEVYRWEDKNGIHLTDSPGSVPEQYREKVYAETSKQIKNATPQVNIGIAQQNIPVATQPNQAATYQSYLEQQRRATESMRQQQARALAENTKQVENAFASLARGMILWLVIGVFIFIAWVSTIVDIVRSEFYTSSNKTVWMLLVIFIPLMGMVLYHIFGHSQKDNSKGYRNKQQKELLARLNPREPKDKDFVI